MKEHDNKPSLVMLELVKTIDLSDKSTSFFSLGSTEIVQSSSILNCLRVLFFGFVILCQIHEGLCSLITFNFLLIFS